MPELAYRELWSPLQNNMSVFQDTFLTIVRLGIGHYAAPLPEQVEWSAIEALAGQQGLSAIVIDGIEIIPEEKRPPKMALLQWIGEVFQNYENRYAAYKKAISELAAFYNGHGFKMMVLKGYACSLDWPKPEHRPCGDIDIWLFGKQKEADEALNAWFKDQGSKFKIDTSHHHHTVYEWKGFTVENHYDFVNVHAHKMGKEQEKLFKELGKDDSYFVEVNGEKVYLPSPNLHALFLIRHLANHFVSMEITLRQVLDWALFAEKHTKEIDWFWLVSLLEKYHLKDFYNCINVICVGDLGFDVRLFGNVQFAPDLKDKILNEILEPDFSGILPNGLIDRLVFKYKRWNSNKWKRQLVYNESTWSAFWSGVWGTC